MIVKQQPSSVIVDSVLVKQAVKLLKSGKYDGDKGLVSNHLMFASDSFYVCLAQLLSAILIHGHQPGAILRAVIQSIPKDIKGNLCSDENYRGIALTSSIGKVFDLVFLLRNESSLLTSDLQYAFKKGHGTVMCTLVVKEVVKHYLNNGSDVAGCFLDATKAFDRLRYDRLFSLLIDRNMNVIDLRALKDLYERQFICAKWKNSTSSSFGCTNGIRQGGIASPTLYCIYMDELLSRLKCDGYGCWMGRHYLASLCYADDLTLLSPTHAGLQNMLKTCEDFAAEFGLKYNAKKSVCILFCKKMATQRLTVWLCGERLDWVQQVKHLGNVLSYNLSETAEVNLKKGDMVGRTNLLYTCNAPDTVIREAFQKQVCHFYGVQAWDLSDPGIKTFHTMWNRCARRVLGLPSKTHTRFLPHLLHMDHSSAQVYGRFIKLVHTMTNSKNETVRYLAACGLQCKNSIIGQNIDIIGSLCDISVSDLMDQQTKTSFTPSQLQCSQEDLCIVQLIRDFRDVTIYLELDSDPKCEIVNICAIIPFRCVLNSNKYIL
jgi:hypothetical protein